jgi:hypothetical protein
VIEFECCECRRHIIAVAARQSPEPPLCAECLFLPGWPDDPRLRAIFNPELEAALMLRGITP